MKKHFSSSSYWGFFNVCLGISLIISECRIWLFSLDWKLDGQNYSFPQGAYIPFMHYLHFVHWNFMILSSWKYKEIFENLSLGKYFTIMICSKSCLCNRFLYNAVNTSYYFAFRKDLVENCLLLFTVQIKALVHRAWIQYFISPWKHSCKKSKDRNLLV